MNLLVTIGIIMVSVIIFTIFKSLINENQLYLRRTVNAALVIVIVGITFWFLTDWQSNLIDFVRLVSNT